MGNISIKFESINIMVGSLSIRVGSIHIMVGSISIRVENSNKDKLKISSSVS